MEDPINDGVDCSEKEYTDLGDIKNNKCKVESKKKEERWKPADIEKFLELYERYPCLWDYKIPEYKDRNAKEHSWTEIIKFMGKIDFTVKKAKEKIRVLRNTYSNELMKTHVFWYKF